MEINSETKENPNTGRVVPAAIGRSMSLLDVGAVAADRAERELVRQVLDETHGNRKLAARRMNICYKALLNKLKRWSEQGRAQAA